MWSVLCDVVSVQIVSWQAVRTWRPHSMCCLHLHVFGNSISLPLTEYFWYGLYYILQVRMMGQCKVCAISHAGPSAGFLCVQISWFKTGGVAPCVLAGVGNQKGAPWNGVVAEVSNAVLVFILINVPCCKFLDHDTCSSAHAIARSTCGSFLSVWLWDLLSLSHFIEFLLCMQIKNFESNLSAPLWGRCYKVLCCDVGSNCFCLRLFISIT